MVKLIYCISKKAELSVEEFQRYWRETHGPIAGRIPGVRRYVQCHVVPELYGREQQPAYDGAAELWFDDLDSMRAAMGSPELKAALEDEKNFIDHTRVASFVTIEKP
ncbi:MAG: EthD family reductase, partial [Chloroflexi bacterium]|nr:EthD family reductase [Chloroflexota bacterium]